MCFLWDTLKTSSVSALVVKLQGMKLTVSTFYNYLGVIMDKSLSYKEHIGKVLKKSNSRVKLLSHTRQDLTPHVAETIYKVMILPLLLYCSNVFIDVSPNKKQQSEKNSIEMFKDYKW